MPARMIVTGTHLLSASCMLGTVLAPLPAPHSNNTAMGFYE